MKLMYPKFLDRVDITVTLRGDMSDDGTPSTSATYTGKCVFCEVFKQIKNPDGTFISLTGRAIIGADIAPSLAIIKGTCQVNGVTYVIYASKRPRNPDGTIHHTELELM